MSSIRRPSLLWLYLLGLLLVGLGGCAAEELDPMSLVGAPAADLRGEDLTGAGVTDLAALAGKPTAVVFWLNTCPHCQEAMPQIQEGWADLESDYNILTVGVTNLDMAGTPGFEDAEAFTTSTGLTLPTIEYTWEQAQAEWSLAGVPTVFILNGEQQIEDVLIGGEDLVSRMQLSLESVGRG